MNKIITRLFWILIIILAYIRAANSKNILQSFGLIQDQILIAGTGSMYPTFPKGEGKTDIVRAEQTVAWPYMRRFPGGINLFGYQIGSYNINRSDIVDFENKKTDEITKQQYGKEAGFVKRIIAVPGDTIEIRDGFVYLNSQITKEPYTAAPRSTYGGDFLPDCKKITIPENQFFVMGDNRKGSLDSRYSLGLVSIKDIRHILPINLQDQYKKNWRSTENDESQAHQPTLNISDFILLLNQKRKENNLSNLKYNSYLSDSAQKRAGVMLATDDFSIEATRSGYTLEKSIADSGYDNITFAETFARGYYDASELVDNLLQFPETQKLIFNKDYQDIGISVVIGDINNCPVQVVVVHLGGYLPPNYKKEDIDPWQKLYDNLNEVIVNWQQLKGNGSVNQEILNQLLNSLNTRKNNTEKLLYKFSHNLWLSPEERQMAENDKNLSMEEDKLIKELQK